MAKRGSPSGRFRRTRWSGVYERNGLYYPRLYVGKVDGRSKFEWLDPQPAASWRPTSWRAPCRPLAIEQAWAEAHRRIVGQAQR